MGTIRTVCQCNRDRELIQRRKLRCSWSRGDVYICGKPFNDSMALFLLLYNLVEAAVFPKDMSLLRPLLH